LKIAAKIDKADEAYFRETIAPLLDRPGVQFLGEIGEQDKARFLGDAIALLFPIDWPEPFGLVMIESMACATPVLAFRGGSTPEIIDERVTGCLVSTVEEAIHIMPELLRIDRRGVRRRFEERFSAQRMATDYVRLYRSLRRSADMRHCLRQTPPRLYLVPPPARKGVEHLAN
jgi:glycosyltransferase involved in cell wall biosynthesis